LTVYPRLQRKASNMGGGRFLSSATNYSGKGVRSNSHVSQNKRRPVAIQLLSVISQAWKTTLASIA